MSPGLMKYLKQDFYFPRQSELGKSQPSLLWRPLFLFLLRSPPLPPTCLPHAASVERRAQLRAIMSHCLLQLTRRAVRSCDVSLGLFLSVLSFIQMSTGGKKGNPSKFLLLPLFPCFSSPGFQKVIQTSFAEVLWPWLVWPTSSHIHTAASFYSLVLKPLSPPPLRVRPGFSLLLKEPRCRHHSVGRTTQAIMFCS